MATFRGIIPPTVTLFSPDQSVDWDATLRNVDTVIEAGVHGIFALGTTGEWTLLSLSERKEYAQRVVERVNGRVPVIVGTGGTSTAETIEMTRHAKGVGASAAAVVTPFYQRLDDAALLAHFGAVANAVNLPILVYNIPPFTGTAVSTPVLVQLAEENDNIVGVKDSLDSADLLRTRVQALKPLRPNFSILTGISEHLIGVLAMGGDGGVFGEVNFAAAPFVACYEAFERGDYEAAIGAFADMMLVTSTIKVPGTFQAAIKEAMHLLGQIENTTVRLPGTPLMQGAREQVRRNLENVGMLRRPAVATADTGATIGVGA